MYWLGPCFDKIGMIVLVRNIGNVIRIATLEKIACNNMFNVQF